MDGPVSDGLIPVGVKDPAASSGGFDPRGSRQMLQTLGSLLAGINKME